MGCKGSSGKEKENSLTGWWQEVEKESSKGNKLKYHKMGKQNAGLAGLTISSCPVQSEALRAVQPS